MLKRVNSQLSDYRDIHKGETIVVCGCGESLNDFVNPEQFVTIGVNDVGRLFNPTYLVVLNPKNQFKNGRFKYVQESEAQALFTQLDLMVEHLNVVRFKLGMRGSTDYSDTETLPYTQNSPYVAICLAALMGAKKIGVLGVDYTDNHFFAKTGRHVLSNKVAKIDNEYQKLAESLEEKGVEIFNLSIRSKVTAFKKITQEEFSMKLSQQTMIDNAGKKISQKTNKASRVFFVNYKFLSCGEVFTDGLAHGADSLSINWEAAYWDDPELSKKVDLFKPDLIFVVHGRKFIQRWKNKFQNYKTAVWLLDEPYEVDDTSRWSCYFNYVFVNDLTTLQCHKNSAYLPVCYDDKIYKDNVEKRQYAVGFVGGYNAIRERYLLALYNKGLLSYIVGGPWKNASIQEVCLASNIPAASTADLYRNTRIIINVFRNVHHFNKNAVPSYSMNPRIYEAIACGAVVVSEARDEIKEAFPMLPQFSTAEELSEIVEDLLVDENKYQIIKNDCKKNLLSHSYGARLKTVADITGLTYKNNTSDHIVQEITQNKISTIEKVSSLESKKHSKQNKNHIAALHTDNMNTAKRYSGKPHIQPLPFTAMPKRNLIYHIWPVKGSVWQWNLDQLLQRIDIFNGRRIIAIVHDKKSESPETIKNYLNGHGCDFIVEKNESNGECVTFPRMLEEVCSRDCNEVTFYAHAKGVKYEPEVPQSVRRWSEVQYRTCLDDWNSVSHDLQRFAVTGPFKRLGRYKTHHNVGDWHYCGTYFWIRHAQVFARDCLNVHDFYGGVEAWPGFYFRDSESGCLFLNTGREAPYLERFWQAKGMPALKRWESNVQSENIPPDLLHTAHFDGHEWPRTEQKPKELEWWVQSLLDANIQSLLVIGSGHGGVEWHVARRFRQAKQDIDVTSVELNVNEELKKTLHDASVCFQQELNLIEGNSSSMNGQLKSTYDAVFIDGDHSYRGVQSDWNLAKLLKPRVIGFHDIVDSNWHIQSRCCVSRLWSEIKTQYKTEEIQSDDWGGIGVVWL